jgi:hypothetical protein
MNSRRLSVGEERRPLRGGPSRQRRFACSDRTLFHRSRCMDGTLSNGWEANGGETAECERERGPSREPSSVLARPEQGRACSRLLVETAVRAMILLGIEQFEQIVVAIRRDRLRATLQPWLANSQAVARPIPADAPVITATCVIGSPQVKLPQSLTSAPEQSS